MGVTHATSGPGLLWPAVHHVALRRLKAKDAYSLAPLMQDAGVSRFMPGAPRTVKAFHRFSAWTARQHVRRGHWCLAIAVDDDAVGLIQMWPLDSRGRVVEWGFALGQPYWGQGLFNAAARTFIPFAIRELGVERLEARTLATNTRAMAALLRLGARPEGLLRQCLAFEGELRDATLWAIVASEWRDSSVPPTVRVAAPERRKRGLRSRS